jgi:hypothetical protein
MGISPEVPVDDAVETPVAEEARADIPVGERVRVHLTDGQVLRGKVAAVEPGWVILHIDDGDEVRVSYAAIAFVEADAAGTPTDTAFAFSDSNRTRYFYSPSAFSLGKGRGYVSQKEIAFTTVGYGLTDWFSVELGTVVPLLFTPVKAGIVGAKIGVPVGGKLHVGGGVQMLVGAAEGSWGGGGFLFGNVTYGVPDSHFTVGAGQSLVVGDGVSDTGPVPVVFAANHRVRDNLALMTESWVFVDPQNTVFPTTLRLVPSGGVRFLGQRFAADVGAVLIWTGESEVPLIPIPWLDLTWNFG